MDKLSLKIALIALLAAIFISPVMVKELRASSGENSDVLTQVLGGTAELASEKTYNEADVYFHGGTEDVDCPDHPNARHKEEAVQESDLPLSGLMHRTQGIIAPRDHKHLVGRDEKEVLPWFQATVELNPHHIDAWREGAYWFYRTKESRKAQEFILAGIKQNPDDYRLYLDAGILYHRLKKWDKATLYLESAERHWQQNNPDADVDLRAIRTYLKDARKKMVNG